MPDKDEKISAVRRMQAYIMAHCEEEITLGDLARAAAYSPCHALRLFVEYIGETPMSYLRAVRLSRAAVKLRDTNQSVLDIALAAAFGSHEGFTKAFSRHFSVSPQHYRQTAPPLRLFCYYPVQNSRQINKEENNMQSDIIFAQVIERPARRLILKRGIKADEYMAYCREVGCDVWGILESIKGALYESVGVWLPDGMMKPGTSRYCQGVEVPADFSGIIPDGFDMIDLPACKYMVFQGEPFDEQKYAEAIQTVWDAVSRCDPKRYGWQWAPEDGPRFQLAPFGARGYIEGLPVRPYTGGG